jgi:maltokinase
MTDPRPLVSAIPEPHLRDFLLPQRWFAAKARQVDNVSVVATTPLRDVSPPLFALAVLDVRFEVGMDELYQVPIGLRQVGDGWDGDAISEVDGWIAYDAMADPELARELVHLARADSRIDDDEGAIEFRSLDAQRAELTSGEGFRLIEAEQSNSSVVLDEHLMFKLYRRLQPGINPELELLRFLTERNFPGIAAIAGWATFDGHPLEATLAIFQRYLTSEGDGWTLALDALSNDPDSFLVRLGSLGTLTGALHSTLASEPTDPSFAPLDPSPEAVGILIAWVDELVEDVFSNLPDLPVLEPIAGRGEEVRATVQLLGNLIGNTGRAIRGHGDYHLGQALWTGSEWVVLDFEGEPARTIAQRRRKRSPLRDVAGMLRSFAYVASASELERGVKPPPDWEERARTAFLEAYLDAVDQTLLPPGREAVDRLLALLELEKAVYELKYELNNRPDWVPIPVAGITRLLGQEQ